MAMTCANVSENIVVERCLGVGSCQAVWVPARAGYYQLVVTVDNCRAGAYWFILVT